ncbi:transglutaminase-like domain-containing protein [Desulfobulbus sp.]|uniref:transglutaminase-like domain-containing protein n=1 Tax=Desulfobulbus sp. TaxID=895 RepID=UPI0038CF95DB
MERYLAPSLHIDYDHPEVRAQAAVLAQGLSDPVAIARRCFEFVRDAIRHSWDFKENPVTCHASEVLRHRTGYCYAKSHLLAALLRANRIPAGLCYQRLEREAGGTIYCLHGLNAVLLPGFGWYRIDARGNKPGVAAAFCPPEEQLAFHPHKPGERDLAGIWPEPLPLVIAVLERCSDVAQAYGQLPDIEF